MKKPNENVNDLKSAKDKKFVELKEYKTPTLTSYGDISELVLTNGTSGGDGGGFGMSFSM